MWFNHKRDTRSGTAKGLTTDEYTVDWRKNVQTSKWQNHRDVRLVAFPKEDVEELLPSVLQPRMFQ